jgi:hypothetical protein
MLTDPKIIEAWFTLMAEAMRGSNQAQDAFRSLSQASLNPGDLNQWFGKFMPGLSASSADIGPEAVQEWLEQWWRMMGVVPRSRYLELLGKNDDLKRRLEQAQETIHKMRAALERDGKHEQLANNVLDMWSTFLDETLKVQTEWAKAWNKGNEREEKRPEEAEDKEES